MNDEIATHGFCPRCAQIEPVVWSHVKICGFQGDQTREFVGLEMKCRSCGFEITKVGKLSPVQRVA